MWVLQQMTLTLAQKDVFSASQLSQILQYSVLKPQGSFNRDYGNPGTYSPTPHIIIIQLVLIKWPASVSASASASASASGPLLHNQLHDWVHFFTLYITKAWDKLTAGLLYRCRPDQRLIIQVRNVIRKIKIVMRHILMLGKKTF